jgi:8-oxo-dGTP pyrophosphatase MutT (NUDIX family)
MNQLFFAQKAFIVWDRHILLIRKSDEDPDHPGRWEVPGGRMEFGEDVEAHLQREVREEVGLEIEAGRPFHIWQWRLHRTVNGEPVDIQVVAVARLCTPLSFEISTENRVEGDFLDEVEWVPLDRVQGYTFIANMQPVVESFLQLPELQPHTS